MFINRILAISLFSLFVISANAGILPYTTGLISTPASGTPQVVKNTSTASTSSTITPPTTSLSYTDLSKKGMITFGVDHHFQTFFSSYVAEITVKVTRYTTLTSAALPDTNIVLKVSYQPNNPDSLTFVDKQTFTFNNVEAFRMSITNILLNGSSVNVLPANLYLQGDMFVDRIYNFAPQTSLSPSVFQLALSAPQDRDCDGVNDKITVSWQSIVGAEEYQLEWTYVNDYGLSTAPNIDFSKNSTRISTTKTSYDLSLIFDKGYVCFRLRAVGRSNAAPYRFLYTNWTTNDGLIAANAAGVVNYHIIQPYDISKNWQYSTTYAEEGKQKEVISFYDGSLRNRQMVTKINTDKNTIVGETIYDHLGRAMIQVLPTPVTDLVCFLRSKETSLKYYENFNRNLSDQPYNAENFAPYNPGDTCNPQIAVGMSTTNGASKYYSPSNPNTQASQAYVPNASNFPFSQVQYMPDNTGRVRSQGGVGEEFQIGNGHESKYFYAHPFQEQLDRLFGSEVGDAAHYQKNMVVDPNGQVSVSYLDQEGRVVATSLAGQAPENLIALPSQDVAGPLTVDLFAKDFYGNSASNVLSPDGMSKVFNQTIALSSSTDVTINYGLEIDGFHNDCLPENVCFECVYDLEIEVKDLCGKNHAPSYLSNKMTGHFTMNNQNEIVFALTCDTTYYHPQFTIINLPLGTYQISKKLSINQAALNYYVSQYIDTTTMLNQCLTDYEGFYNQEEANSNIDDCNEDITCAECVQNLGGLLAYIQAGGTEEEYNAEVAACNEPCKPISFYETQREIILTDVMPGGQYGEYMDNQGATLPSIHALSVFNTNNSLPKTNANWRFPIYDVESTLQNGYFESDGVTLSKIYLSNVTFNASAVSTSEPAVISTAQLNVHVFLDATSNEYYTYPQYLNYESDFIDYYMTNTYWANSLVYYHPEYPMLSVYKTYTVKAFPTDTYSSESFDQKMLEVSTFQEAQTVGILSGSPYAINGDPFAISDPGLTNQINNYLTINGVTYSMFQVAAMMTRCPNSLIGYQPTASCAAFGTNYGVNATENTAIRNAEWLAFRGLYISAKQKRQLDAAILLSLTNPNFYGYNACIGNDDFNPFENGFFFSGQFTNAIQPCNNSNFIKYKEKTIRFGNAADYIDSDPNQVAYQMYLQTGQCPIGFAFQNLLNQVASEQTLDSPGFPMNSLSNLSGLLMAINNFEVNGPLPVLDWLNVTNTGNILEVLWNEGGNPYATFKLQKNPLSTNTYVWDEIIAFNNLQFTQISGGLYEFTIDVKVNQAGTIFTETLTGNTTLKIGNCTFPETCETNDQGKAMDKMLKLLALNNQLTVTSNINIHTSPYTPFFTTAFEYAITTAPSGSGTFKYDPTLHSFVFTDGPHTLKLNINSTVPSTFNLSNLSLIEDLQLEAGPNNTFKLNCYDAAGLFLVTLECDAIRYGTTNEGVSFGECGLAESLLCHGLEYETFDDLENLLKHEIFPNQGQFELKNSPYWTNTLDALLASNTSAIDGTTSTVSGLNVLTFNLPGDCELVLTTKNPAITFYNLVTVNEMHTEASPNQNGAFYDFYLLVTYNNGTTNVNDTIFGTSCFKLKECDDCTEDQQPLSYSASQLETINYSLKVAGVLEEDNTIISYADYLQVIDATNTRLGWDANNPNHLEPISYVIYFDNGLANLLAGYLEFATTFVDQIDDYALLTNPFDYIKAYGSGENLLANYDRYVQGTTKYNTNRQSNNYSPATIVSLATFSQTIYSEDCSEYLQYLSDNEQNIATALPLNNYPNAQAATIDESTCLDSYTQYFNAYQLFVQQQNQNNTCLDYQITMPLVPYQSFIDNNLCCSNYGLSVLTQYIASFSVSNTCPGELPLLDDCLSPTIVDERTCEKQWYFYTEYINQFNNSDWAINQQESIYLDLLYPSFTTFLQMGYCDCVEDYSNYLQTYINASASDILPTPQTIDEFCGLIEVGTGATPCQQEYETYLHCVAEYNVQAMDQGEEFIVDLVTMRAFYDNNLCYCVDEYCSQLNMVLDGLLDFEMMPNLFTFCNDRQEVPCVQAADSISYETFELTFNDPCTEFYESNIEVNAYINFTNQVQNLQTEIAQQYIKHCMDALETMSLTFNEFEHHFTLYYYDQAGNLIKTVPPEGVEMIDINDPVKKLAIKYDRENNTHTIVTNHRMATTYVYNSLNQLVAQNMPDQDAMTIFESIAPNGLQIGLNTTAIQMVDANQGYLTGYITNASVPLGSRGYLYKTTNGGNNWTRVTNALGADLKKVVFVSSTTGYAIANDGMILKTTDAGFNWDLLNTAATNVYANFIDLEIANNTAYTLTPNGNVYEITATGLSSTVIASPTLPIGYTYNAYKDFTLQNTIPIANSGSVLYVASLSNSNTGITTDYIVRNTSSATIEQLNVLDLKTTDFYSNDQLMVAGVDGNLSKLTGTSTLNYGQLMVPSGTTGTIDQLYMVNDQIGIARLEENAIKVIRKTTNGGQTWENLSSNFPNATMTLVKSSTSTKEVLIQGFENGKAYSKVVLLSTSGVSIGEINQTPNLPQTIDLKAVASFVDGSNITYFGVDATNKLYRSNTFSTTNTNVVYTEVVTAGILPFSPIELVVLKNGTGVSVEVLASNNKIYRSAASTLTGAYNLFGTSPIGGLSNITALEKITISSNDYLLAYDKSANTLYGKQANSTNIYSFNTLITPATSVLEDIKVHGNKLTLVGTNGGIFTSSAAIAAIPTANGNQTITFENRKNNSFSRLNEINTLGNSVVVIGDNGLAAVANTGNSSNTFVLKGLKTTNDIFGTAYRLNGADKYYGFVGSNGMFIECKDNTTNWTLQPAFYTNYGVSLETYVNGKTLRSATVNGQSVYLVGDQGQVYYTADINQDFFIPVAAVPTSMLKSVVFIPTLNKAIAVGDQTEMYRFTNNFGTRVSGTHLPKLEGVDFETAQFGSVIGSNYFLRTTNTGAGSWQMIKPSYLYSKSISVNDLKKVATRKHNDGTITSIIGTSSKVVAIKGNYLSGSATIGTAITDLQFSPSNHLKLYISSGAILNEISLIDSANYFTLSLPTLRATSTATINAIHVFDNNAVIMAGNSGKIYYYNATLNTQYLLSTSAGVTFNDIYFRDHKTGVAVGDNGAFYYLDANGIDETSHEILTTSTFSALAETIVDPIISGTGYHIKAISYNDINHAVYGGNYTSLADVNTLIAFVRSLKQERNLYSARFFYDRLGRIVVSQNSRQQIENKYSYTLYDGLGRVFEAGEKSENQLVASKKFKEIFGTYIGGSFVPTIIDDANLATWLLNEANTTRKEVTRSYYDKTNAAIATDLGSVISLDPTTQRKRIIHVSYEAVYDGVDDTYDHATHYDYDIHGNVKTLIQDNRSINSNSDIKHHRFKRMDYIYDLISGNVHRVDYQTGNADQWHHTYHYDADNRITNVFTSSETPVTGVSSSLASLQNEPVINPLWDQEAKYTYYAHGPLARTVLGEEKVQGLDYVYTLQGWIKSVNSNTLDPNRDPGQDGASLSTNRLVAQDVYGYSLHYFEGDFGGAIGGNNTFVANQPSTSDLVQNSSDLYNGNIARMVTTITDPDTRQILPLGNAYRYDQLNRLKVARSFNNIDFSANKWNSGGNEMYYNAFDYDANGNIIYQRRMDDASNVIDEMTYYYTDMSGGVDSKYSNPNMKVKRNRLSYVKDDIDYDQTDIDPGMASDNYQYDAEGRLIADAQENIEKIYWRVDGKVKKIERPSGVSQKNVSFDYDAMGHRIAKHVYSSDNIWEKSTFYVLDARGNTMSVYEHENDDINQVITFEQTEKHIYGSSQLGTNNEKTPMFQTQNLMYSMKLVTHRIGERVYELSNHLNNVLSVISDKVIPHQNGSTVDYFLADIRQSQDYSPFGVLLKSRNFKLTGNNIPYDYGFNGIIKDDELKGEGNSYDFGARMYDSRLGRWLTIDALTFKYPSHSPYNFVANMPIIAIDPDGNDVIIVIYSTADPRYQQAAWTRVREIKANSGYDKNTDKIIFMAVSDLGEIKDMIEYQLNTTHKVGGKELSVKDQYGLTVELSYYGHGGTDGPIGTSTTSGEQNLKNETGIEQDKNQMTLKGWSEIDFNFAGNSVANFYGCSMSAFASKFSVIQCVGYASGYGSGAGPTTNPETFESSYGTYEYMYLWDGNGLDVYKHRNAGKQVGSTDADGDGYNDMEMADPTDPAFWSDKPFFSLPVSSGNYSTNLWISSDGVLHGYKVNKK